MHLNPGNQSKIEDTHVAFYLPTLEGGGAERAVLAVANSFARLGLKVDLVLGIAAGPYLAELSSRVNVVNLRTRGKLVTIWRLTRYLWRFSPNVIMAAMDLPNLQTVIASKLAGYKGKLIISQRATIDAVYASNFFLSRIAYCWGLRLIYPLADRIISNSCSAEQELINYYGIDAAKVITISNQIDSARINLLATETISYPWLEEDESPVVISVGSLTPRKDMETVIRAFALVRKSRLARLIILGEGAQRRNLEALITELGLSDSIRLPGFDVNPYKWICKATVLVSASHAEGFPNVVAEALALGTQVVATDCPGDTSKLLGFGRWGRLVGVRDPGEMASAICDSLAAPIQTDLLKGRAKDFSPERTIDAYLNIMLPGAVLRSVANDQVS